MINGSVVSETNIAVKNKQRGIGISAFFYIIYAAYYVSGYTSMDHNYVLTALFALWVISAMIEDMSAFVKSISNTTFLWLIAFISYYFLTSLINGEMLNTMKYIAKYIMLFFCVLQFDYYKERNRFKEIRFIVICVLAVWIYFAVKSISFYTKFPSVARLMASDFYLLRNYALGGGYAIAFGSAILCVYLFEQFINKDSKGWLRLGFAVCSVVLFYLLIKVESTLTLIGGALGIVAVIIRRMWRNTGEQSAVQKIFVSILMIIASMVVLLNIQDIGRWITSITEGDTENVILRRFYRLGQKMMYFGTGASTNNYIDERFSYIVRSWETFLKNPIIGVGFKYGNIYTDLAKNGVGMHSAICDVLAQHGILGAIPMFMFFLSALRKRCKVKYNTYIVTMIFMIFVNPFEYFHIFAALFTLIPMIDMLIKDGKEETLTPTLYGM